MGSFTRGLAGFCGSPLYSPPPAIMRLAARRSARRYRQDRHRTTTPAADRTRSPPGRPGTAPDEGGGARRASQQNSPICVHPGPATPQAAGLDGGSGVVVVWRAVTFRDLGWAVSGRVLMTAGAACAGGAGGLGSPGDHLGELPCLPPVDVHVAVDAAV